MLSYLHGDHYLTQEAAMDSLLFLIESKLDSLPESELKIARYILKEKKNVIRQTVSEIAKETGSSTSAVVRLCRSLGIPGFHEMKIMLARDVFVGTPEKNEDPSFAEKSDQNLLLQTGSSSIESLKDLTDMVSMHEIRRALDLLEQATFIHTFGIGLSSGIAFDLAHKMQRLGLLCGCCQETQMQMLSAGNLKPGMTGVIISHSGNTHEMVKAAQTMKAHGVKIIAITGNRHGDITFICDVILFAPLSEPLKRQGASSSRISQLVLIDMLFSLLINRNPEKYSQAMERTQSAFE